MHNWEINGFWALLIEFIRNSRDLGAWSDVTELDWGITRHFIKGCAMLVLIRFGIVLLNFCLQVAQQSNDSLMSINGRNSRTIMREIFCMHTICKWRMWDFGPPMVVHGSIRSTLDFIWNKIIINWIWSLKNLANCVNQIITLCKPLIDNSFNKYD